MPSFSIKKLMLTVAACALVLAGISALWRNSQIIEELENPLEVRQWSAEGLILGDGRMVRLPGVNGLPTHSRILKLATESGVAIQPDGRVIGLVKVHHWCGNGRIRRHYARVDLADLLIWFQEGKFSLDPKIANLEWPPSHRVSESGWEVGDFHEFRLFHEMMSKSRAAM